MKNEHIEWVSIDDLIGMLEDKKALLGGDTPVCVSGISALDVYQKEYYYDGGYCALDVNDRWNVIRSKNYDGAYVGKTPGFNKNCVVLRGRSDESYMRHNGRPVRECDPEVWEWLDLQEQEERTQCKGQLIKYKVLEEYDKEMKCYPMVAYLDSGEEALGNCPAVAKTNLIALYREKHDDSD